MSTASKEERFYRAEGALWRLPTFVAVAWFAFNAQRMRERALRVGSVGVGLPLVWLSGKIGAGVFATRMSWMAVRGMSEDRLVVLAEEYREQFVRPRLLEHGIDSLRASRSRGERTVLVSDNLDLVVG